MGTELTPQQLDYVKIAQASGNSLVALISDVLDLSKIEAGRMEIETVPFDMLEEVDNILSLFEEKVHLKQLEISALVHDSVPQWLYGDPGRLRQVLIISSETPSRSVDFEACPRLKLLVKDST